jgi:hypothetical protein
MDKFNRKNAKDAKYQAGNIVFACSEFQVRWIPTNVIVNRRQTFLAFFAPWRFVLCGRRKAEPGWVPPDTDHRNCLRNGLASFCWQGLGSVKVPEVALLARIGYRAHGG